MQTQNMIQTWNNSMLNNTNIVSLLLTLDDPIQPYLSKNYFR